MKLKNYLDSLERGGHKYFAERLGVSMSYLSQMASGKCPISPEKGVEIEMLSGRKVTRKDTHPDSWMRIWPELIEKKQKVL